jgi:hypothetical protein
MAVAVTPAVTALDFDQIGVARTLHERMRRRSGERRCRRDDEGNRQGERYSKKQFAHRRPHFDV